VPTDRVSLQRLAAPLVGRRAWLRWVHLILGGALLMPYNFAALLVVQWVDTRPTSTLTLGVQFAAFGVALPLVAATAFFPAIRTLELAAAKVLVGGPVADLTPGPAVSRSARCRAAIWYVLHLAAGGIVSGTTLAVPPAAVFLVVLPFLDPAPELARSLWPSGVPTGLAPLAGLALLVALVAAAAGVGAVLARLAPALLGPSPADRLAELERRTADLAARNRLARELHDSVGHALSLVTIQAGAAGRVIDSDPEFARRAMAAIEESARSALGELDHALGLLREEPGKAHPVPTLTELDRLLEQARLAGVDVHCELSGDLVRLPSVVSREAYRIVQEGLTNARRHAGAVPVRLRVDVRSDRLALELTNPIPAGRADDPKSRTGGRGLTGVTERVTLLGGRIDTGTEAGADGSAWRVAVEVPL
jgi:signal transduction histidine kinase